MQKHLKFVDFRDFSFFWQKVYESTKTATYWSYMALYILFNLSAIIYDHLYKIIHGNTSPKKAKTVKFSTFRIMLFFSVTMATVFVIILSLKYHILKEQVPQIPKMYTILVVKTVNMTLYGQY